jgi:hypothetical protein
MDTYKKNPSKGLGKLQKAMRFLALDTQHWCGPAPYLHWRARENFSGGIPQLTLGANKPYLPKKRTVIHKA